MSEGYTILNDLDGYLPVLTEHKCIKFGMKHDMVIVMDAYVFHATQMCQNVPLNKDMVSEWDQSA